MPNCNISDSNGFIFGRSSGTNGMCPRDQQSNIGQINPSSVDHKQVLSAAEQREQYYATVRKPIQQNPCGGNGMNAAAAAAALERIPEYSEDIYPYATFHLPDQENLSGNPMMVTRYSSSTTNSGSTGMPNLYDSRDTTLSLKQVNIDFRCHPNE